MNRYNLIFKGYWRDCNRQKLPEYSGVYLVYKCIYNDTEKTVKLLELIYIGQAENIRDRIKNHDKQAEFQSECKQNQTICYATAEVKKEDLNIVENALIFAQKPRLNKKSNDKFEHKPAEFHLEGKCKFMKHLDFTIE